MIRRLITAIVLTLGIAVPGMAAAAPALAAPAQAGACHGGSWANTIGIQPGSLTVWWTSSSNPEGCAAIAPIVHDNSGNTTHGGLVWHHNGIKSKATTKDGKGLAWAKIIKWINGGCQLKTLDPVRTSWSSVRCPGWVPSSRSVIRTEAYHAALMSADHARSHLANTCSSGKTKFGTRYGPPGSAWVELTTNSNPKGCIQYRVSISSTKCPSCRFRSGWIKNSGIVSGENTCIPQSTCPGGDGSALANAWEDRRNTGTSAWQCRNINGIPTRWRRCTND
jgi:hypothetical protein